MTWRRSRRGDATHPAGLSDSPSNPEGAVLKQAGFTEFLDRLPLGLPLVLDEAYFEYCSDPGAVCARDLLAREDRPNFGLRTFSKFYALASMRVGYAYARPEYARRLNCAERIFSISHLSETAAIAALQDQAHRDLVREGTLAQRRRMEAGLEALGLAHLPSEAPFLLAELPAPLEDVVARFAQDGIILGEKASLRGAFCLAGPGISRHPPAASAGQCGGRTHRWQARPAAIPRPLIHRG